MSLGHNNKVAVLGMIVLCLQRPPWEAAAEAGGEVAPTFHPVWKHHRHSQNERQRGKVCVEENRSPTTGPPAAAIDHYQMLL